VSNNLDPRRLEDLRQLHILDLIRNHPREIEADPGGAPMLRGEVVALSPSDVALEKARKAGFSVLTERVLEGLDARLIVLRAPDGMTTRRALKQLKELDSDGAYDFNHLYTDSGEVPEPDVGARSNPGTGAPVGMGVGASTAVTKIGLIDSGIDT